MLRLKSSYIHLDLAAGKNRTTFIIMKPVNNMKRRELAKQIFYASLEAVDPYRSVKEHAEKIRSVYQSGKYNRFYVIGFGKAACPMANAIEDSFLNLIDTGILITKYKHCNPPSKPKKILVHEAGHPIPDENGLRGTKEIISILKQADENTLVICLISGGGSALLVSPCDGITLDEKKKITDLLLKAGADIFELNTIRKHISNVKGGRLAEIAHPSKIISLILSDVIGDRLDIIASGPTFPDNSTFNDALNVLEKYNLIKIAPIAIIDILRKGADGLIPETPREGNIIFERIENIIIGSNKIALNAAKEKAENMSLHADIISYEITGEAKDAGNWLARKALEIKKIKNQNRTLCLISGGETTVNVRGNGLGGRNMELALSFASVIEGIEGITLLSAGTDGTDGPTDAAGAIVDGNTVRKARDKGIKPEEYLNNNNSYYFFKEIDELLITGPTGTNVMDIQIMVVE